MRAIVLLSTVLLVLGYAAYSWDAADSPSLVSPLPGTRPAIHWVRTADGWEKTGDWLPPPPVYHPPIHPLALAGLQLMLSLGALVAYPGVSKAASAIAAD